MGAMAAAVQACRERMTTACAEAGRPAECARLLAVGKTFPAGAIREAHAAGLTAFGESYLQEALEKLDALADLPLEWHFIGPLQSNKTRPVAERFAWVHGVEREKIARRLSEQRPSALPPLNVCVQVNVSGEAGKHGVAPDHALDLARLVARLPNLRLRGFMTIPEADSEVARARFSRLRGLLEQARAEGLAVDTLSMGMSADLEAAILEGSTMVRIGSALFGARPHPIEEQGISA
ncbi:MAG: YggS family pyridoxal phosphate-dependent enzyme [Pseudomonadota bacterium]|nr:YggS family pyridoxal phosphate-dependent enzyme [Pseudomonadota bacterium]MDP1904630.1 YggS family pyridoxal phosphate-dependent enzyme [Pseudomonadota bacterium]MDP2353275.1 YggS family pyridoxal phosphate-dependent enzyme [Pseudomonadota bacterium]